MKPELAVSMRRPWTPLRVVRLGVVAAIFSFTISFIFSVFTGRRQRHLTAVTTDWSYCARRLAGLQDPALGAALWSRTLSGRDNADGGVADPAELDGEQFSCRCRTPPVYPTGEQPQLTAIVQSFNHRGNIANISGALKASKIVDEIVVCEDGSTDGSLSEWHDALPGPQHFIIRSNNLHELRSYNRAMRMSAGDVVCLLQDDDLLPYSDEWLRNARRLFETKPDLGLLGGYIGQLWDPETGAGHEFGEQRSTHGGLRQGDTKPIQYVDPVTGVPFMYVECVWIAPVFARRSLLRKAGGLELAIAKRGEPGVWQDCVFSYETWVNGFSVGVFDASFERGVGGHGSATSEEKVKQRERVWERAVAYTNRKYYRRRIHDYVGSLNNETLRSRFP
jgi:glycosyltransferase involved in cell wall biosynthesis